MTNIGPQSDKTLVLPLADAPLDNMVVDFIKWGDMWMWTVYWCDYNGTNPLFTDVGVTNEMGTITVHDQPYGRFW